MFFFFLHLSISIYGQVMKVEDQQKKDYVLNPYVYLLKEQKGIQDISNVIAAPADSFFRNPYLQEVNYGFNQSYGWCKFTIANNLDSAGWILKIHQGRVDSVQLYVQKQNGELLKYPLTGHFQKITDREIYSTHFAFVIPIGQKETINCYLYTQRKFGRHAAVISLHQVNHFTNYDHLFFIYISIICGIILLASLVGIVLCIFVFDKVYIYYSVYCLSFIILVLCDSGFIHSFWQDTRCQELINNFNMIFYYWIIGWHLLFTIELLSIKTYPRKWVYWVGYGSGFLFCFIAILMLCPISDPIRWWLSLVSYYVVFYVDAYICYLIIIKLFKREPIVYFYMAGFLFTLLVASILMLADLQILEGINHITDLFYITPVIEIICMVIGLGIHFSNHVKQNLGIQIQLNETQHRIITIQEEERKRMAQDLHDDLGNSLAAIKNFLAQKKDYSVIEREIDNLIQNIRNISHNMMPVDFENYDLADIVRQVVNKFRGYPGIEFEYDQTGEIVKLNAETELIIYRIINELMTNSIKHSNASHVLIQIIYQDSSLVVMVEDNGVGINETSKEGIGLRNIRHRVAYIGATINIESDNKGILVIIEIPYANKK